ncbi:MAG: molybdopterin converting factor subunit 1 [Pseudanabaenaceae cyanobacterium SKYGB_i_bin29]|nr:molybdopterin converting factor subunit 1 [Pseudanabaenaceae cyanobacterium SKYG29]MDW8422016.1 molybdopterin converting factor subunit 1 [Pseudanabaenaceae cyanobacterium SKYGB_i_bin29]
MSNSKTIKLTYFAHLRDRTGISEESRITEASTCEELYQELQQEYQFSLCLSQLKVAVNDEFADLTHAIKPGDHIVFIPPVAGG